MWVIPLVERLLQLSEHWTDLLEVFATVSELGAGQKQTKMLFSELVHILQM